MSVPTSYFPLAWAKWLVSRVRVVDNYCHRCGRKTEAFGVHDDLWQKAVGDSDPLCFRCFDRAVNRRGLPAIWRVKVEPSAWPTWVSTTGPLRVLSVSDEGRLHTGGVYLYGLTTWQTILRGDPCAYCGRPFENADHIQPRAAGGTNHWSNLTACCHRCNQQKASVALLYFLIGRVARKRPAVMRAARSAGYRASQIQANQRIQASERFATLGDIARNRP